MLNLASWAAWAGVALAPAASGHFLWEIDSDKPSYLYGTVHSSDASVRRLPAEVVEALRRSESFHPELELSPENIGRVTAAIFAPGARDLEEELPPELWERLVKNARRIGLPAPLLRRIQVQLSPLLFATPPEMDFNGIVDIQVYELAKTQKLAIHPLETVDEQIRVFRDLTREEAIGLLEEALDEAENGFPSQEKIVRLYAAGEAGALMDFLTEEFSRMELPELQETLLDRRNESMSKRLLPHLEKGGAFVAVGVGHMPGEAGLIALLEKKGYQVAPVPLGERETQAGPEAHSPDAR